MKICFPVEVDKGLESKISGHFGSAPNFILYDTETRAFSVINNQNLNHAHGQCNPAKALNGQMVDAIIVGGIGAGAINKLNDMDIKVYSAHDSSVLENIGLFESNNLFDLALEGACGGHEGGCEH